MRSLVKTHPMSSADASGRRARSDGVCARLVRLGALAFGGTLLLAACGGADYESSAEDVIEGDLADSVGLGAVVATCDKPEGGDQTADGDVFTCTATTESGEVITYSASASGDNVEVATTNVIIGSNMAEVERITAESLTEQIGIELPAENVDCGETSVIITDGTVLTCGLMEPGTEDIYDTELSNIDINGEGGNVTFDIAVAETPRG